MGGGECENTNKRVGPSAGISRGVVWKDQERKQGRDMVVD